MQVGLAVSEVDLLGALFEVLAEDKALEVVGDLFGDGQSDGDKGIESDGLFTARGTRYFRFVLSSHQISND